MQEKLPAISKDHFIIFKDGSLEQITRRQYEQLLPSHGKNIAFLINGCSYNMTMVSKLLSPSAYREQYPQKATQQYKDFSSLEPWKPSKATGKGREQMLIGLKRYIDNNETTGNAEDMYALLNI